MYAVASRGADSSSMCLLTQLEQHDKSPVIDGIMPIGISIVRENVRTKGCVATPGVDGDIKNPIDGTHQIRYKVRGSRGSAIKTGIVTPNRWGGFELDFTLPKKQTSVTRP